MRTIAIQLKALLTVAIAVSLGLVLTSCSPKKPAAVAANAIPAGPLMQDDISYQFAIYYLPVPGKDPNAALDRLLVEQFSQIKKEMGRKPGQPGIFLAPLLITNVQEFYRPPSIESLKYFGRGISRDQAGALQGSQHAMLLNFGYSKPHLWDGMRAALQLTAALAEQTGGLIWDEETREVFTPHVWVTNRLSDADAEAPDVSRHIALHGYRNEEKEYARAITLGMIKFGLPDVVVEDFSWSESQNVGHLINVFEQVIAEGAAVPRPGEFDLDVRAIKNADVRESHLNSLKTNATGRAWLSLQTGRREEGDPTNRLVEITFDRYRARDLHDRQGELLWTMFGRSELVVGARRDDEELLAASRRARERLPALRELFNRGLTPGEHLLVKAAFKTPNGRNEYMWVEVSAWNGDRITGLLRDEPLYVPGLHGGQTVTVSEKEVFDYARYLPDGTVEGDETSRILEKYQGK